MYTTFMGFILLVMVLSNLNKKFCFCVSVIEREHTWLVVLTTWYIFNTKSTTVFLFLEKAINFLVVKILVETSCNLNWCKLLTKQNSSGKLFLAFLYKWAWNSIGFIEKKKLYRFWNKIMLSLFILPCLASIYQNISDVLQDYYFPISSH